MADLYGEEEYKRFLNMIRVAAGVLPNLVYNDKTFDKKECLEISSTITDLDDKLGNPSDALYCRYLLLFIRTPPEEAKMLAEWLYKNKDKVRIEIGNVSSEVLVALHAEDPSSSSQELFNKETKENFDEIKKLRNPENPVYLSNPYAYYFLTLNNLIKLSAKIIQRCNKSIEKDWVKDFPGEEERINNLKFSVWNDLLPLLNEMYVELHARDDNLVSNPDTANFISENNSKIMAWKLGSADTEKMFGGYFDKFKKEFSTYLESWRDIFREKEFRDLDDVEDVKEKISVLVQDVEFHLRGVVDTLRNPIYFEARNQDKKLRTYKISTEHNKVIDAVDNEELGDYKCAILNCTTNFINNLKSKNQNEINIEATAFLTEAVAYETRNSTKKTHDQLMEIIRKSEGLALQTLKTDWPNLEEEGTFNSMTSYPAAAFDVSRSRVNYDRIPFNSKTIIIYQKNNSDFKLLYCTRKLTIKK